MFEYADVVKKTSAVHGVVGASPFVLNEVMVSSETNLTGAQRLDHFVGGAVGVAFGHRFAEHRLLFGEVVDVAAEFAQLVGEFGADRLQTFLDTRQLFTRGADCCVGVGEPLTDLTVQFLQRVDLLLQRIDALEHDRVDDRLLVLKRSRDLSECADACIDDGSFGVGRPETLAKFVEFGTKVGEQALCLTSLLPEHCHSTKVPCGGVR